MDEYDEMRAAQQEDSPRDEQPFPASDGYAPVAWLHVLDNTDGIPENEPMKKLTFSAENPFGKPDKDYSKEYTWTATPLFFKA